jgi:hypothetical protein
VSVPSNMKCVFARQPIADLDRSYLIFLRVTVTGKWSV